MGRDGEERRGEVAPRARPVAAPGPLFGRVANARADRIQNDVSSGRHHMLFRRNLLAPEPVPEQVLADIAVPVIRKLRVHPVQELHPVGKTAPLQLDQQVEVIRHQHERVTRPVEPLDRERQQSEEEPALLVVLVDCAAPIAPGPDVVEGSGNLDAWLPCHRPKVELSRRLRAACHGSGARRHTFVCRV